MITRADLWKSADAEHRAAWPPIDGQFCAMANKLIGGMPVGVDAKTGMIYWAARPARLHDLALAGIVRRQSFGAATLGHECYFEVAP